MAEAQKKPDEKPVVIDGRFVRVQATQAMRQFFRPLTVVFEPMKSANHLPIDHKEPKTPG